jgi:hypothetical protein
MTWHELPAAPDLTAFIKQCRNDFASMALTSAFGGGIDRQPMAGLFRNLHRLTIRTAEEYNAALAEHRAAIAAGAPHRLALASSHWEGCVEALHRSMKVAETLRVSLPKWAPDEKSLRIERQAQFQEGERKKVRGFRDACQHIDTEIENYTPTEEHDGPGRGLFIMPLEDRISFHGYVLAYGLVAGLIRRLIALCHWFHMQEIPADHPLAHEERTGGVKIADNAKFVRTFDLDLVGDV